MAADEKFPVLNGDNITIPIQMQLLLNKCLKSPVLEDPSTGNMVNVPKHCSNLHHICQILWLLVNTLAAYQKFPVFNGDNLTIPCQMQIYQKHDFFFFSVFAAFLKSRLNFKHFEGKDNPHTFCIFEVTDSANVVR